jgi:hypothetical protein
MTASGGHTEQQPIIVHNPAWNKWAMGFAAIGFFTPEFIIRPTDATLIFFNFFGGVLLLFTLIFARNQISLVGNRFSIRGLIVRKSVSLDLLTSISAYPTRGKFPYWNFRLCDQGGEFCHHKLRRLPGRRPHAPARGDRALGKAARRPA